MMAMTTMARWHRRLFSYPQMSTYFSTRRRRIQNDLFEAEKNKTEGKNDNASRRKRRLNFGLVFSTAFKLLQLSTRGRGIMYTKAESRKEFRTFGFISFDAKKRNYMHHRGENERKVWTFSFFDSPCVVNMRGRCKIDLGHSFRRLRRSTLYRRPIFKNMEGNGARITQLTEAES